MIGSDAIRGYNDIIILNLLTDNESYGYEVSKQIAEITGEKYTIKETTLYSAFKRLEKQGYITSFIGTKTNGNQRTYYKITDDGKEYYKEKCEEWEITKEVVDLFIKENL